MIPGRTISCLIKTGDGKNYKNIDKLSSKKYFHVAGIGKYPVVLDTSTALLHAVDADSVMGEAGIGQPCLLAIFLQGLVHFLLSMLLKKVFLIAQLFFNCFVYNPDYPESVQKQIPGMSFSEDLNDVLNQFTSNL